MLHHLRNTLISLGLVPLKHVEEQVLDFLAEIGLAEVKMGSHYFIKHPFVIFVIKWWQTSHHLIEQHA